MVRGAEGAAEQSKEMGSGHEALLVPTSQIGVSLTMIHQCSTPRFFPRLLNWPGDDSLKKRMGLVQLFCCASKKLKSNQLGISSRLPTVTL
jgi:hypothetical protein